VDIRKGILESCVSEWMHSRNTTHDRSYTLEGLRDVFCGFPSVCVVHISTLGVVCILVFATTLTKHEPARAHARMHACMYVRRRDAAPCACLNIRKAKVPTHFCRMRHGAHFSTCFPPHAVGQRLAVEKISSKIKNRQGGWGQQTKPLVAVFLGPSGTGKTELAKQLASIIHGRYTPVVLFLLRKCVRHKRPCLFLWLRKCVCVCMHLCSLFRRIQVCVYVHPCMGVCIHIHTYMHTHRHTDTDTHTHT
jgi:hypothetical protein